MRNAWPHLAPVGLLRCLVIAVVAVPAPAVADVPRWTSAGMDDLPPLLRPHAELLRAGASSAGLPEADAFRRQVLGSDPMPAGFRLILDVVPRPGPASSPTPARPEPSSTDQAPLSRTGRVLQVPEPAGLSLLAGLAFFAGRRDRD